MSSTPSRVLTRNEHEVALATMAVLRYGDLGVVPALLDADTDHEQRVLVLTADIPGVDTHEAPIVVVIQDKYNGSPLFDRLTHPDGQVVLEDDEDSEGVA